MSSRPFSIFIILASLTGPLAFAQAEAPSPTPDETVDKKTDSTNPEKEKPKPKGTVKRTRDKEAEGTEARDRFKADTVIKSKYKLDGESLEVDPD